MYLIVTNNPMAAKEFAGQGEVRLYPRIPIGRSWCGPEIWCI